MIAANRSIGVEPEHWGHILSFGQMGLDGADLRRLYKLMTRTLRTERPGGRYHVTARRNERKDIFRDDADPFHFSQRGHP